MSDPANPWTLPETRPAKRPATRKAGAKRPAAKRTKAGKASVSPSARRARPSRPAGKAPARPARKARAKRAAAAAPEPARRALDLEVRMRPVRPAPEAKPAPPTRSERLAAMGHAPAAAAPARPALVAAAPARPALVAAVAPGAPPAPVPAAAAPAPGGGSPKKRFRFRNLFATGAVVLAAVVALAVVALPAISQGNSGTIKVHDGEAADPPTRNEPHVTGDVWVEGFNMAADGGDLLFYSWPPTGDMTLVDATTWEADDAAPEFHFLAGPFELPCGHYRVFAYNGDGPEDPSVPDEGGAKKKSFWVECPPESEWPPHLPCPTGLAAVANDDGSVTLAWTEAPGSNGTNVYRAEDGGDFEYLATVPTGVQEFTDDTTVPGTAYEYSVTAFFWDRESQGCSVVEVTAIPELPTVAALGLAAGGGALALALMGRRRK